MAIPALFIGAVLLIIGLLIGRDMAIIYMPAPAESHQP
jgi:hypothetical protein